MHTRLTTLQKIISIASMAIILCACTAAQNVEAKTPPAADWKKAYLDYLDKQGEYANSYSYSLIYVNDDDIPEFVQDTGISAGGCQILTFHDGSVDEVQIWRCNFSYIKNGNLLCNFGGHMGSYYDYVYTIEDGKWVSVAEGEYGDGPGGFQLDENGNEIFVYQWNGKEVNEEEYQKLLYSVYPLKQPFDLYDNTQNDRRYIASEMRSLLQTGEVTSAEHHYELIVQDLSWEEARRSCEKKGGYLAVITSWEEMEQIQKQILAEKKTNISFWVEANNGRYDDDSWGFHWTEPETGISYDMMDSDLWKFWRDDGDYDEPSYVTVMEDGTKIREDCAMLVYPPEVGRCCLEDKPEDILSVFPSYAGKIGYICEYSSP